VSGAHGTGWRGGGGQAGKTEKAKRGGAGEGEAG
jgi:hypothetical protein